jgi:hypothetical protein
MTTIVPTTEYPRPEFLRTVPVAGDRVYYSGSLTDLHGFGTVGSRHGDMAHVEIDATLDRGIQHIRCRAVSIEVVSTGHRCDNCGSNGDAYPVTLGGNEWDYCGPCRDAHHTRTGRI